MTITTKFNVGESVWVLDRGDQKCPTCGNTIYMGGCLGTPTSREFDERPWVVRGPLVVSCVSFMQHISQTEHDVTYQFEETRYPPADTLKRVLDNIRWSSVLRDKDIFETEAEAVSESDNRNAQIQKGRSGAEKKPQVSSSPSAY
jgi:hypothetical protein